MAKYRVDVRTSFIATYEVEADSPEEVQIPDDAEPVAGPFDPYTEVVQVFQVEEPEEDMDHRIDRIARETGLPREEVIEELREREGACDSYRECNRYPLGCGPCHQAAEEDAQRRTEERKGFRTFISPFLTYDQVLIWVGRDHRKVVYRYEDEPGETVVVRHYANIDENHDLEADDFVLTVFYGTPEQVQAGEGIAMSSATGPLDVVMGCAFPDPKHAGNWRFAEDPKMGLGCRDDR